jgi:hypothetical protein
MYIILPNNFFKEKWKLGNREEHNRLSVLVQSAFLPKLEFIFVKTLSLGFFTYIMLIIVSNSQLFEVMK